MVDNTNNGGNAKSAGIAAAAAKGAAEQAKATAQAQQQQAQSRAGPQANPRSFDSAGNLLVNGKIVQFADRQAQESYLSARGVSNTGQIVNPSLYANADWSNLGNANQPQKAEASTVTPSIKPEENYGYTSKVESIISNNFAKDPTQTNWDLVKTRPAIQARKDFSYQFDNNQGGVKTKASEALGASKSWSNLGQSKAVAFFTRGSDKEEQAKQSEADRALGVYGSQSNKDYQSGGTQEPAYNAVISKGKAEAFFGKTKSGVFGWNDVSKDQLVRGSDKEEQAKQSEAFRASPQSAKNGGKNNFISLSESLNISSDLSGSKTSQVQTKSTGYVRNTEFIDTISTLGQQGAIINIVNSKNQILGQVSGPNAYRDFISQFGKSTDTLYAEPIFSTTREGKQTTENLISNARTVGSKEIDVFLTQNGKPPQLIEALPLDSKAVGSALDKYAGNSRISFGTNPKQIENPKDTTLVPASVTALDLNYVSSKDFTGQYFDIKQQVGGFLSNLGKESKLPATAPGETTNLFGIKIANPSTTLYEAGQNFGSFVIGGVKSIPPLAAGLATSYYNFFTKGTTEGPATKVQSPTALANVLGASFLAPQTFMGEQASKNFDKTAGFIHSNIGVPLKEQGINTPQTVQNPKTIGSFVGTIAGVGTMLAPLAKVIPVRVAGEAGTIAFPGIGRIKSAGPLAGSEPYTQGPKTITITGVTLGYGGARTVMLYGKSSEGKSFILSRLKPEYNPQTGKENLHLETYYSSAERGSPFPESTKLTLSKLANEKAGSVFSQIKNEQGTPKFSESEFGLELKAKEANKYYNKIPNQKVSEESSNKFFGKTSITENPETTVLVKQIASALQSRSESSKKVVTSILSGDTKLASSYATFAKSPLQPIKGSPIVAGQLTEFNLKQERANQIPQPKAESVKDIDIELSNEKQSESLLNILNAKVERPEGYEFSKQGTNIYYGLKGEKGKEVFNLLVDKDVNPTDLSTSAGSGVFGKAYPTKTSRLGKLKTKQIGYQARALTNSLSATHNLELMEKTKATTEPKVFAGIKGRLSESEHIITAFTPRVTKDLSRNVAVLDYGIKTTKGKARQSFIDYKNALLEKHQYVDLETVSGKDLAQELATSKAASKSLESDSILSSKGILSSASILPSSKYASIGSSKSLNSSSQRQSVKSSFSSKSSKSLASAKSVLSTKSINSMLPTKSSKSTTSTNSPKSPKSVRSTYSIFSPSSPISPSSPSSPNSPRSFSSSSPGSPYSLPGSPVPPFSSPGYPTNPSIKIPKLAFNLGRKRRYKIKSGPTGLRNLGVKNPFSSNLNIKVTKRYEF